ncbi:hypothetical protein LTR85_007888 [Meristemomyces frigidus]|nr:hypothetical protein LTR85_007888 [Meristemomyces frigidus]
MPLQDAALKAANVIDYLNRAVDSNGQRLPVENIVPALTVAAGAGFSTTSSLLSWLIYGLVAYDGMQDRLLQELVGHGSNDDTEVTPEILEDLPMRTSSSGKCSVGITHRISLAVHHREIWDNPDLFDPDRWDTERVKNRTRTEYMPMCIGFNFALQEIKVFMCLLVWRYQWLKEGEPEADYDPFFQLIRPINLYVRTTKRSVWPSKSDSVMS